MYEHVSAAGKEISPPYERGGMRFDLALSDPLIRNSWRKEYTDRWEAPTNREWVYRRGFMFPDEPEYTVHFCTSVSHSTA